MPTYEPGVWNATAQKRWENNCYNYATNIQKNWHPPLLPGAEPGSQHGKSICWPTPVAAGPDGRPTTLCDYKCARGPNDPPAGGAGPSTIMEACRADGLKDPVHGRCQQNCWLVAVYVRRLDVARQLFGDYHFVRQDTLPNGTTKWSHKPGDGPVTDQTFAPGATPGSGAFNGGPITNPATDNVGIGPYVFCGYLCCCPGQVSIASRVPEEPAEPRDEEYAVALYGQTSGMSNYRRLDLPAERIMAEVDAAQARAEAEWRDGLAEGAQLFYIGLKSKASATGLAIMEQSVTRWDPKPRHFLDPSGHAAARFKDLLGWWPSDQELSQ